MANKTIEPIFKGLDAKRESAESGGNGVKRYTLVLPDSVFQEIKAIADKRNTTILEILKKFIVLGLIADKAESTPGSELILRTEDQRERSIILV